MLKRIFSNESPWAKAHGRFLTASREGLNPSASIVVNKIFLVFVIVHIALFAVNFAEWGDSYRILRASEYVREFSYPEDEKRSPLFSVLLALRPANVDQVSWARFEMLLISVASFVVFSKLLDLFRANKDQKKLALTLFTFNPVYLYWSLRVMADVPFTFFVLLSFYLLKKWEKSGLSPFRMLVLGLIVGLSVLTRFEGYILGFSVGLSLLFNNFERKNFSVRLVSIAMFGVGSLLVMSPWLLYRNPFTSSYFEEPSGRVYDLNMVLIYLSSLTYLFGFTSALVFLRNQLSKLPKFFAKNIGLSFFVVVELFLALIWPAAIPRLFTPVIPFLIIPLAFGAVDFFSEDKLDVKKYTISSLVLLAAYILAQYFFKLQFLVLNKALFVLLILIQLVVLFGIHKKAFKIFYSAVFLSALVWSVATVFLHKDIFRAVVLANKYAVENLEGDIAYNDVSSVSDWYLNQKSGLDSVNGKYINMDSRDGRSYENLLAEGVDYIMITNEHNTDLEFSADENDYLEEIKEFRYTIRGKTFFTKIAKFNK